MIEEAAGTKLYESKRESARKTIEKKDAKLQEMDSVTLIRFKVTWHLNGVVMFYF